MSISYQKVKSVGKKVTPAGPALDSVVLGTMKIISDTVGSTLGPGGRPVLIERQEHAMPPIVTKDGVTVFRSLGLEDATQQVILEAARDCAVKTAADAGDGTTTATVLAEALVRNVHQFTKVNPRTSPQKVLRSLDKLFNRVVEPVVKMSVLRYEVPEGTPEAEREAAEASVDAARSDMLYAVAKTSANGDEELADKVLECYDLVGDDGNVTIVELNGPSSYKVERIDGYAVGMGYEESCGRFYQVFVNDRGHQRCYLEKPCFLLYHGKITEIQTLTGICGKVWDLWQKEGFYHNLVLIATGFSESVLGSLAVNFDDQTSVNVFPLLAPVSFDPNGQLNLLEDIATMMGATVLNPMNPEANLDTVQIEHLGFGEGVVAFEATRYRSTIIGHVQREDVEQAILLRAAELKQQIANPASQADKRLAEERLGKLTGGIARLKVTGSSNGETKEKRDRAEDAVCAVRGAVRHGALPGGGWTFLRIVNVLQNGLAKSAVFDDFDRQVAKDILAEALLEVPRRLLRNVGQNEDEINATIEAVAKNAAAGKMEIYDALADKMVQAVEAGVLDSTPAVLEAIRNSLSIAGLVGTLGGTVVFRRDAALERSEAQDVNEFNRQIEGNAANERP